MTTYASQAKLDGLVAMFLKYLCDKETFLTFDLNQGLSMFNCEVSKIQEMKNLVLSDKFQEESQTMFLQILDGRMGQIKMDYSNMKKFRQLPTIDKRKTVTIRNPRLFPFSKAECQVLLKDESTDSKSLMKLSQKYVN